jgi:hypothetical protein
MPNLLLKKKFLLLLKIKNNLNNLISFIYIMTKKACALCGTIFQEPTNLNICKKCIGFADCCIGLEKL